MPESPLLTYDLNNIIPDISKVFDTLIANENGLLNVIKVGDPVYDIEPGWIDDIMQVTQINIPKVGSTSLSGATGVNLTNIVNVGAQVRNIKNADIFTVSNVTSGVLTVAPVDGEATPVSGTFAVNNLPVTAEASTDGVVIKHQGTKIRNNTQIFRANISISNTALETATYDGSSEERTQYNAALFALYTALSYAVWFGKKSNDFSNKKRTLGGLYTTYAAAGGTSINAGGALSYDLLSTLAAAIASKGGRPNALICNKALGAKLTKLIYDNQKTLISDDIIGSYARYFRDPVTGYDMRIVYDDACPVGDLWMGNVNALEIRPLGKRNLVLSEPDRSGIDATNRYLIKEVTLFVHNAYNNFGYLTGITL